MHVTQGLLFGGLSIVCAIGVAWSMSGPGIHWAQGAELPRAKGSYSSGIVNGRLVLAGGTYWKDGKKEWLDEVAAYDPVEDRWSGLPRLPRPVGYAASVAKDDVLLVLGGCGPNQQERAGHRLKLANGKYRWEQFTTLPFDRCYAQAVVLGTNLYLIGGSATVSDLSTASKTLWKWPLKDERPEWKMLDAVPGEGRAIFAATGCGGKIYVFGGCYINGQGELHNLKSAYEYDPMLDRWKRLKDLPLATRAWSATSFDDRFVFLFGGYSTSLSADIGVGVTHSFESKVYRYDVRLDRYEEMEAMPHANADISFHWWNGAFYGSGGEPGPRMRSAVTLIGRVP